MSYSVKEIYYTLHGEGHLSGRPATFLRFSGCNLWSGREEDRKSAICKFCDTDFVGFDGRNGGKYQTGDELAKAVDENWPSEHAMSARKLVVLTGGEPLLQLDLELVDALHRLNFEIAVETNGTVEIPSGLRWRIYWLCVSPKAGTELKIKSGNEIKLVYPQENFDPSLFCDLDFNHHYLQAMDGLNQKQNTQLAIQYCLENPMWSLSVQTQKIIGLN